jgi:tRNA dimethylallyltransferase
VLVPVLVGPTGVGKTALATVLAGRLPIEIVSADSRQVYRGLEVGTAAPSPAERAAAPYHGLGVVEPTERYSAGRFARDAAGWTAAVAARGRTPLVVGGTGLYVRALFDGLFEEPQLDAERRARLGVWLGALPPAQLERWAGRLDRGFRGGGRQRAQRAVEVALLTGRALSALQAARPVPPSGLRPWYVVLTRERAALHERIARRTAGMLAAGWVAECRRVLAAGVAPTAPALSAVGYREIVAHLEGRLPESGLAPAIAQATRQYAKRQETWFRHQLAGPVLRLDAGEAVDRLAAVVLSGYRAAAGD